MSVTQFKAIFFDMDGLLVDTEPLYLKATQEILATIGIALTKDWYVRENLGKGTSSFELAKERGLPDNTIKELRQQRNEKYDQLLKGGVQPLDGVPGFLEWAQGKFVMGIVTSSHRDHFETIMRQTGLRKFFSFFITGDDVENVKPDPEPYLKAVGLSGHPKEHCLVLEDSYRGLQAAKAAGLTCYAIPDALTKVQNFSIADKVLGNIRELPEWLGAEI